MQEFNIRARAFLSRLSNPIIFLLSVSGIYSIFLALDFINIHLTIVPHDSDPYNVHGVADYELFKRQAEGITRGQLLYRDVYADSPPFIIYLLAVPYLVNQVTGIHLATCYKAYYSLFTILTSLSAMSIYKQYNDETVAALLGLCLAFHLFTLVFTFWSASDEIIAAFFVVLAVLFLERKNYLIAAALTGLAFQTKFYPVLIGIHVFKHAQGILSKVKVFVIGGIFAILPFIPFYVIKPGFHSVFIKRFASRFPAHGTGLFAGKWLPASRKS